MRRATVSRSARPAPWSDAAGEHPALPAGTSGARGPVGGMTFATSNVAVVRGRIGVPARSWTMRTLTIIGILLICLGILALVFQGFTFFTQERVVDAGPFKVDWQKPHTVILHPIVGIVALAAGVVLLIAGRRSSTG